MGRITKERQKRRIYKDLLREVQKAPGPLGDALYKAAFGPLKGTDEAFQILRTQLEAPENRNRVASILHLGERVLHSRVKLPDGVRRKLAATLGDFVHNRLDHAGQVLDPDVHAMLLKCFVRNRRDKASAIENLAERLQEDSKQHSLFITFLLVQGAELCQLLDDRIANELLVINYRAAGNVSCSPCERDDATQSGIMGLLSKAREGHLVRTAIGYSVKSTRHAIIHIIRKEANRRELLKDRAEQLSPAPQASPADEVETLDHIRDRIKKIEASDPDRAEAVREALAVWEVDKLRQADELDAIRRFRLRDSSSS